MKTSHATATGIFLVISVLAGFPSVADNGSITYQSSPDLLKDLERQERIWADQSPGAPKYERSGHQYTTHIVAVLAGLGKERSHRLAYFSQFPDDVTKFSATSAAINLFNLQYRKQIMAILHSLHGGNETKVKKRREDLKQLIQNSIRDQTLQDYQIGLIIHAFADSYAHTKIRNGKLEAYGYNVGHLFHGHTPDTIAYYPEKFKIYTCELFKALSQKSCCEKELKKFHGMIDRLKISRDEELPKIEIYARDRTHFKDAKFDGGYYEIKGEGWRKEVTKEDVLKTINIIEQKIAQ